MLRVTSYHPAGTPADEASGYVTLAHDQRHLRRKLLHLQPELPPSWLPGKSL